MLEELFVELKNLLWGIGIISAAILIIVTLPKKISYKLGEYPLILMIMFSIIVLVVLKIFI